MPSNSIKVVTIGSALIDVFIKSSTFELDPTTGVLTCGTKAGKLEVESFDIRTGGGASNTAVGFARMGFDVACIAEMGRDDQAQLVVDDLSREQVGTAWLIKEKKEQTGGSVVMVTESGERMVLVHRGAASMLDPQDIPPEAIQGAGWIHVSSLGNRLETLKHIFNLVVQFGVKLSWNPGSNVLKTLVEQQEFVEHLPVEVCLLNKEEWELVGSVQSRLLAKIPQIVVTDGEKGGQIYMDGQLNHTYHGLEVEAVDNTGAGDAFAVGYVSALLHQRGVPTAADWGARNAASVVQQVGAKPGLLTAASLVQD
jgi:ribokinase